MEIEKIRNLSDDELKVQQLKSAEELFRLRFRMNLGNAEGVKKLRGLRLDIARIKTVERERELGLNREAERAAKPAPAAKTAAAASEEKPAKKAAAKTAAKKAPAKTVAKKTAAKKATAEKTGKKD